MADRETGQAEHYREAGVSDAGKRDFEDDHPSPWDAELSDGEMREDAKRDGELRERWPCLYAHKVRKEKREREEREKCVSSEKIQRHEKKMKENEELVRQDIQRQREHDERENKLQEYEKREENLRLREIALEEKLRRFEELLKEKSGNEEKRRKQDEEKAQREELERLKTQKSLAEELKRTEAFAEELKLRINAICSRATSGENSADKGTTEGAGTSGKTSGKAAEDTHMQTGEPELAENKEPYQLSISQMKGGLNKWKEGDDYRLWRRIAFLEFAKFDCRFLVDPSVTPLRRYTPPEKRVMESGVMEYILSNFPEKYQRMLDNCETSREMIEKLDLTIIPTTSSTKEVHHTQLMNLYHDPAKETVVEFRARVQHLVNNVKRHSNHELTQAQIRRNVLGAISGAYPTIYKEACENRKMTLNQIFGAMSEKKETFEARGDLTRSAGSQGAMLSGSCSKPRPPKRKAPPVQGDLAAVDKSDLTCFKCGFKGHWASECKNPGKGCYNCHGFGHKARECKKPQGFSWRKPQNGKKIKHSGKGAYPSTGSNEEEEKWEEWGRRGEQGESSRTGPNLQTSAVFFEGRMF